MSAAVKPIRTEAEEVLLKEILENTNAETVAKYDGAVLPHRRIEEWKYTDIRSFWREPLQSAPQPDAAVLAEAQKLETLWQHKSCRLTFVNGWLVEKENIPQCVSIQPVQNDEAPKYWTDAALQLNDNLTGATLMITIPSNTKLEAPIHFDCRLAGAASATYPRVHLVLGDNSEAEIIETLVSGDATYALNSVVVLSLGKNAKLSHARLQAQGTRTLNIVSTDVRMEEKAQYFAYALEEGAALSRNQYFIRQNGEGAHISLNGINLAMGKQHLDTTLYVNHAMPHGESRELFKYVLKEEARGVFQGKIIVAPDAQKTDGQMSARGLLVDEGAEFNAKPELEIYADDVLCAHGATAGELDQDLLFYLRARGIPEQQAKALLTKAFIGEVLERIEDENLRMLFEARCDQWLNGE